MLQKFLFPRQARPKRKDPLRALDREHHFESLFMQSFTEMRARAHKR